MLRQVEVEAQSTRLIEITWTLTFRVSTPYNLTHLTIMIKDRTNSTDRYFYIFLFMTYWLYNKANFIDLSDLVSISLKSKSLLLFFFQGRRWIWGFSWTVGLGLGLNK